MQLHQTIGALAATWILTAGVIGVVGNVTSIAGAAMVLGFGLVPPMLTMLQWSDARAVPVRIHKPRL